MGKKANSSSREEIDSILQRLKRSNDAVTYLHPPNQAQNIMGRRLGVCFLAHPDEDLGYEIIRVLDLPTTSQSVPHGFFQSLRCSSHTVPVSWISAWIRLSQESQNPNSMQAILSFYAWHCRKSALSHTLDTDRISSTYVQLHPFARTHFTSIMAQAAGSDLIQPLLSPIMESGVLTLSNSALERMSILDILLRSCWASELTLETISWQVESLMIMIIHIEESLTIHWLAHIMDMIATVDTLVASKLLAQVICDVMPYLFEKSPQSLQPFLAPALLISQECPSLADATIFRLAAMVLSTPILEDRENFLHILERCSRSNSKFKRTLRTILASIFATDEALADIVFKLRSTEGKSTGDDNAIVPLLGIDPEDLDNFLELAVGSLERMDVATIPSVTQNSFLLLACVLLLDQENDTVICFIKMLLQKLPHLGISTAPVVLDWMRQGALEGHVFLPRLRFMCESLVSDPYCAQEVWNLVGITVSQKDQPLSVRLTAIRMYSTLCSSNRRLYRRIVDSLGILVDERQTEIRLTVVTVVCEMAKQDLIRDVSDVIGWLQTFLNDDNSSIVHLSIMSLHYLVLSGELDFSLVIKVLSKRLCPVDDLSKIKQLYPLVVEALVVLLGDGEILDADADYRDNGLSPQVSSAVACLMELAELDSFPQPRIRIKIFQSLANYSLDALGIDEEAIKAVTVNKADGEDVAIPEVSRHYVSLCKLVRDGFQTPALLSDDFESPLGALARKLNHLEEEALGASIWQKGHKRLWDSKKSKKSKGVSQNAIAALPKPEEIYESYHLDPSASTAIAYLLCFDGKHLDRLEDLAGDLSNETLSPMLKLLNVQAWLQAMSRLWSELKALSSGSLVQHLNEVVSTIQGWSDMTGAIDYTQLALLSLSLFIPDNVRVSNGLVDQDENLASIIVNITTEAEKAFTEHKFADLDIGHLCLAYAGVRSLHSGSSDLFVRGLDTLTTACIERMGSMELYFGMSLMAQCIPTGKSDPQSRIAADRHQCQAWVGQLVGTLVKELQLCFVESPVVVMALVGSIKSAIPTPGLLKTITEIGNLSIQGASIPKAKLLLISLSACVQALIGIHRDLLHSLYHLLLKLPLGSGVEYVLASICSNPVTSKTFTSGDLKRAETKLAEATNTTNALYLSASLDTEINCEAWIKENFGNFKSVELALSLLRVVCTLPVLGIGELSSLASSKLLPNSSASIISLVMDVLNTATFEGTVVLRGLLSSTSLVEVTHSDAVVLATPSKDAVKIVDLSLDEGKLPIPYEGTLLFHIVSLIRLELGLPAGGGERNHRLLCHLLDSLLKLSLPAQFATDLLEPLMSVEIQYADLNCALLRLLLSQFTGRRRATMDGREFVSLAVHVVSNQNNTLLDKKGTFFYGGLSDLIRKSSTDIADRIITDSWELCRSKLTEHGDVEFPNKWLESIAGILNEIKTNTSALSPRTSRMIQHFVVQHIFQALTTSSAFVIPYTFFDCFIKCISEISIEFLDELAFFAISDKEDTIQLLCKTRCVAALIDRGFFNDTDRLPRTITSLFAWFSGQNAVGDARSMMQNVGLLLASSVSSLDDASKSQILLLLVDAMLVHGYNVMALDLFGFVINNVGSPNASIPVLLLRGVNSLPNLSDNSMEQLCSSVTLEVPKNLGSFARRTKSERMFSNRIVQVQNNWRERGAPEETLALLRRIQHAVDKIA